MFRRVVRSKPKPTARPLTRETTPDISSAAPSRKTSQEHVHDAKGKRVPEVLD